MQICITQREGTRYFSRFTKIFERDRLEVELKVDDKKTYHFDLTDALFAAFDQHPEIGAKRRTEPEVRIDPTQYLAERYAPNGKRKRRTSVRTPRIKTVKVPVDDAEDLAEAVAAAPEKPKKTQVKKAEPARVEAKPVKAKAKAKAEPAAVVEPKKTKAAAKAEPVETVEPKKTRAKAKPEPVAVKPEKAKAEPKKTRAKKVETQVQENAAPVKVETKSVKARGKVKAEPEKKAEPKPARTKAKSDKSPEKALTPQPPLPKNRRGGANAVEAVTSSSSRRGRKDNEGEFPSPSIGRGARGEGLSVKGKQKVESKAVATAPKKAAAKKPVKAETKTPVQSVGKNGSKSAAKQPQAAPKPKAAAKPAATAKPARPKAGVV